MERKALCHISEAGVKNSRYPKAREAWKAPHRRTGPVHFTLPAYVVEDNNLDIIQDFLRKRPEEEDQKLKFLNAICTGCSIIHMNASVQRVLHFVQPELLDAIEELLRKEPICHLDNTVRQQAMLAITSISNAGLLLQYRKNSLLRLCFFSVFHLPSQEGAMAYLYTQTLAAMDSMLQMMVVNAEPFGLLELQNIFQLLLPLSVSQSVLVQERAMARIARLTQFMATHPLQVCPCFAQARDSEHICSEFYGFTMLGNMLGHLTLSCTSKNEGMCLEAAEALHHLYIFILQQTGSCLWPQDTEQFLFQDSKLERELKHHSVISIVNKVLMLMPYLQPSQQIRILLLAIKSMRQPKLFSPYVAACIVDSLMVDPDFKPGKVRNVVQAIYRSLPFILEEKVVSCLNRVLLVLTYQYPSETVTSLLECSLTCNNVATAMWELVVSSVPAGEKVLLELIRTLMNQSQRKTSTSNKDNPRVLSLAAATTINKILQEPICLHQAKNVFTQLFLALLFQVSFTTELVLWEVKIFWSKHENDQCSPIRSAVQSIEVLLQSMGLENQVLAIKAQGGWDALLSIHTHLTGVRVVAREMMKASRPLVSNIFCHLAEILQKEDSTWEMVAMTFLVEMLDSTDLNEELDYALGVFPGYLQSKCLGMPSLVLEGILRLLERPSTARKTFVLLPNIMEQLQNTDSDVIAMALQVLSKMLPQLERKTCSRTTLALAGKLQLLFDNESNTVRNLSIQLFQNIVGLLRGIKKKRMKNEVWNSLLPLIFHCHDEDKSVAKASQEAFFSASRFLKWKQLMKLAKTSNASRINECLLTKRSKAKEFLQQSQHYLQSPQETLRLEAVRFIGLLGRQVNEEEMEHIRGVLQYAMGDNSALVRCLAIQTSYILHQRKPKLRFNFQWLSSLLPRAWTKSHPTTCSDSAHAETAQQSQL